MSEKADCNIMLHENLFYTDSVEKNVNSSCYDVNFFFSSIQLLCVFTVYRFVIKIIVFSDFVYILVLVLRVTSYRNKYVCIYMNLNVNVFANLKVPLIFIILIILI